MMMIKYPFELVALDSPWLYEIVSFTAKLYNRRCTMSSKERYGCLFLNSSGEFSVPKFHVLPELSRVHDGLQEIIILMSYFVAMPAVMALTAFPAT
jgi:hypothetical protein